MAKTFWRTQETYDDKLKVSVCMAGMIQAEQQPATEMFTLKQFDLYYDYFPTQRQALNHIQERKKDGALSGEVIKPSLSVYS